MDKNTVEEYRRLKNADVHITKENILKPNAGSETFQHMVAKTAAFRVCRDNGYRVSSEVELPGGQADLVAWGQPSRMTYVVELETSPTEEVIQSKVERYVLNNTAVDDMLVVNVSEMPENILHALEYVRNELGL